MVDDKKPLSDEDLEQVAGGSNRECVDLQNKFGGAGLRITVEDLKCLAAKAFGVDENQVDIHLYYRSSTHNSYKIGDKSYTHNEFVSKLLGEW